jgi:predicted nucleotide-binding protein (sugar kinase/HSP70/actin superfamily)
MVIARPYHMDPGIGHEIEVDLQAYGYPILWMQYFPIDADLMDWAFGEDVRAGHIKSAFDIRDVWPSSYSSNTNEILWGAKVAARIPWIACVVRMSSYECGMDQPTYTPVQQIVERSGTLFFSFQDLDSTKPSGSVKIRVETITHYLEKYAATILNRKKAAMPPGCPLLPKA